MSRGHSTKNRPSVGAEATATPASPASSSRAIEPPCDARIGRTTRIAPLRLLRGPNPIQSTHFGGLARSVLPVRSPAHQVRLITWLPNCDVALDFARSDLGVDASIFFLFPFGASLLGFSLCRCCSGIRSQNVGRILLGTRRVFGNAV